MQVKMIAAGSYATNCYILVDEQSNTAAIIDPGAQFDLLLEGLEATGAELRYILLTHGHFDHTGAVAEMKEKFPEAQLYIHAEDEKGVGFAPTPLNVPGAQHYGEGDTLTLGSLTIEVMHTPGHSPGSVTLKVGDVLFTGDTLFAGSCGRTDFPDGSYAEIMASLKRLGELPGNFHVCPGHESVSNLDRERQYNPFLLEALRG